MRATLLFTVSLTLALAAPSFAQLIETSASIPESDTTIIAGSQSVPVVIGQSTPVTNRVVRPVTPSFDSLISAPIEYDENGVAKAQYFKEEDLSPAQREAFQQELARVRAYQGQNYTDQGSNAERYSAEALSANQGQFTANRTEIDLYEPNFQSPNQQIQSAASSNSFEHRVAKGDTLYNLSKKYNVSVGAIQDSNSLSDNTLSLGQVLLIPSSDNFAQNDQILSPIFVSAPQRDGVVTRRIVQPTATLNRPVNNYAVLKKDTLYSIAKRACVSINDLAVKNNISDPADIQLGQMLTLPDGHCLQN